MVAGEIAALLESQAAPARFGEHRASFRISEAQHTFIFSNGPQTWDFYVIHDGDRVVGYLPKKGFHGGSIYLYSHDPSQAPKKLTLPSERAHIDTALGLSFSTDHFLPTKNMHEGDQSEWKVIEEGRKIQLIRRFSGELKTYKWELDTRKKPLQVDHTGTFTISVDPQCGYVIDATWDTALNRTDNLGQYVSLYPQDMSNPWVTEGIHQRVVVTPVGDEKYRAHANNHPSIHHSDDDKKS